MPELRRQGRAHQLPAHIGGRREVSLRSGGWDSRVSSALGHAVLQAAVAARRRCHIKHGDLLASSTGPGPPALGQLPCLPALAPRGVRLTLRHFRRELVTFRENFMVPDVLAPYNPEEGPPGAHAAPLIDARAAEWRLAKAPRVQDFGERFPPRRARPFRCLPRLRALEKRSRLHRLRTAVCWWGVTEWAGGGSRKLQKGKYAFGLAPNPSFCPFTAIITCMCLLGA